MSYGQKCLTFYLFFLTLFTENSVGLYVFSCYTDHCMMDQFLDDSLIWSCAWLWLLEWQMSQSMTQINSVWSLWSYLLFEGTNGLLHTKENIVAAVVKELTRKYSVYYLIIPVIFPSYDPHLWTGSTLLFILCIHFHQTQALSAWNHIY